MFFALLVFGICNTALAEFAAVKNLVGEPDYRQVKLHWDSDVKGLPAHGFQVRYCELQSWGAHRCRVQPVEDQMNAVEVEDNSVAFSADISGLRMATTYSFEVRPAKAQGEREDRADGDDKNQNIIVIPTKGFSARATQCLPHASEIEVSTGPHFAGRIAVEAADGERCALDGEPDSSRDTYTLRINHDECGSQVNDTTVATFVIVQENLPILTHSTRRFLVLCSYQPETLTVRAGLNLPTGLSGRGNAHSSPVHFEDGSNSLRKGRNLRTGRLMQKPEALIQEETFEEPVNTQQDNSFPIAVITLLSIAGIIGIVAVAIKLTSRSIHPDMDNVSISSDLSVASCTTTADPEMVPTENTSNKDHFRLQL